MFKYILVLIFLSYTIGINAISTPNQFAASHTNEQILLSHDIEDFDYFGSSVSINHNRALISAIGDDHDGNFTGSVYEFKKLDNQWVQRDKILAIDTSDNEFFGVDVKLLGDRALISSIIRDKKTNFITSRAVYVFDYDRKNGWTQTQKLTANKGQAGDRFGFEIFLSDDKIFISNIGNNDTHGSVYVYDLIDGQWQISAQLNSPNPQKGDLFGKSISVFENRIIISALTLESNTGFDLGAVYVFDWVDSNWIESGSIIPDSTYAYRDFGRSVSLGQNRVLIGAIIFDTFEGLCPHNLSAGIAYVLDLEDGIWNQSAQLYTGKDCNSFGTSVSLYGDRLAVGADESEDNGYSSGAAYLFELKNNTWIRTLKILASDGAPSDHFGANISLFNSELLVGVSLSAKNNSGASYLYDLDFIFSSGFE